VAINDAVLADEARVVVTAGADGSVGFWEAASGRVLRMDRAHRAPAQALALAADGVRVASVGGDGVLSVWDARSGRRHAGPWTLDGPASRVRFSPDGTRIVVAGSVSGVEEFLAILSAAGGQVLHRWPTRSPVQAVAFSPEGLRVVSAGSERELSVWDPVTGRETIGLPGHELPVLGLVAVPGTMRLYSAGLDGTVRLWEGRE
jgi:WD40 repeat protein